ncbi:MAG: Asp-tRNA(Asn)/Glu-tRNA(Gln) amidotransferase subunit GatC [Tepidisphaeraceae bacterium]
MSTHITLDTVRDVAKLARLAIPEEKLPDFTKKLESILEYVDLLNEVNVDGVEPTAHAIKMSNVLREDVVKPSLDLEKVLANSPDVDGPFFKVPKVIGGDEDSAS